jgi:hypothetical protein
VRFEVGIGRMRYYARVVEWRVLIGWRVSEERFGEGRVVITLVSNRSRARKSSRICIIDGA